MRTTQLPDYSHHSQDANNANATKNRKRSGGFTKRTLSSKGGRVVLRLFLVGVLAAGFMVVSGRAEVLGIHLPASLTKFFANRIMRNATAQQKISAPAMKPTAPLVTGDLFISEYIEGSATNKAIEIYNGTGAPVNMTTGLYVLQLYSNGSPTVSASVNLTATIADGDVYVVYNSASAAGITSQGDLVSNTVINYNGDDAIVLRKGGAAGPIVDAFGVIGTDPGTNWGSGTTSTLDHTLVRKSTICAGDTNGLDAFDPVTEWNGFPVDTFSNLGAHTASCNSTVTVSGGNLFITDANGGNAADTLTISLNGANVRINDPSNTLTAGAGVTQVDPNTVEVLLASITGNIQVNTLGGNDVLTLNFSGGNLLPAGGLSYAGGSQTASPGDRLAIVGGSQGTVTYNYANPNDGNIVMSAYGTVSYTGLEPISNSGTAADVIFNLPAGPNAVTLGDDGTGGNTLSTLSAAAFEATTFANPTGSVTINRGNAADALAVNALPDLTSSLTMGTTANPFSTITFNGAVMLAANKNLSGEASSTISLSGATSDLLTSGTGTISLKTSRNMVMAGSSSLETVNGGITVEANQVGATAGNFMGLEIGSGAVVRTTGTGNIDLKGKGGADVTTPFHRGIRLFQSTVASTFGGAGAGTITMNGNGGTGTDTNIGVEVDGVGANVTSVKGDISITGQGGNGSATVNIGVLIKSNGAVTATGAANVAINGTSGTGTTDNYGFYCDSFGVAGTGVSAVNGNISITGVSTDTTGTEQDGVKFAGSSGAVAVSVTTTGTGTLTINGTAGNNDATSAGINLVDDTSMSLTGATDSFIADTMDIGSSAVTVNAGANAVTLRQKTNGIAINLGGADAVPQLGLTDGELDHFTAATMNIGNASSGAITVSANVTRAASTNMLLVSNGDVTISGGQINNSGGTLFLDPGTSPAAVKPTKSGTDVTASTLSFGSDLAIVINGITVDTQYTQLNVLGSVDLTGVDLVLGGTHTPVAGQTFTIVDNDLADAITGTFNGLAEGATITNFLGSSLNASITYVGGSGNDVVLTVFSPTNTYTWAPLLGSTNWTLPTNWSPTRAIPAAADILLVDGTSTPAPTITDVPTQTIAAFRLLNGAGVTLNASAIASPHTLTISGATGTDLSIPSGTLLTLAGANGLTIEMASGSVATVSGQVIFQDGPHRIIGNDYIAVRFHFGSICTTAAGFTGNPFGTGGVGDGLADSVVFEGGSKYFHHAGLSPFGTAGFASVAIFQSGNEANWLTSSGFQGSGRVYSTLIIGNPSTATSVSDTGPGDFQFETLVVNSTPTTNSSFAFDNSSGSGRILIQNGITSNGVGSGSLSDVILKAGTGGIVMDKQFGTITFGNDGNNTRGIDFESNGRVEFDTTLALSRRLVMGIVQPNSSILTVEGNITGGPNAYVIGAVRKNALNSGSFTFPVGKVSGYTPLDLANISGVLGSLTVQPRDGSQPVLTSSTSLQEHWRLTENGPGSVTADLTFHYLQGDVAGNEANYRVVVVESANATSFPADAFHSVDTTGNTFTILGVQSFSDWTVAEPAAPTVVKLVDFNAVQTGNEVMLKWQTGYETRNLGYNVYREQDGRRVAITPSLVAGSALLAGSNTKLSSGLSYTWYDDLRDVRGQKSPLNYWLEDVDINGTRTLHGPIAVSDCASQGVDCRQLSANYSSRLLSQINGAHAPDGVQFRSWPAQPVPLKPVFGAEVTKGPKGGNTDADDLAGQQALERRPGVKIAVSREGWYRITQPELIAAGLDANADATHLQLYVNGRAVPIKLSGDGVHLTSSDCIEFYGQGLESTTDPAQTYYLTLADGAGTRVRSSFPETLAPLNGPTSFAYTIERKERMIYFSGLRNGAAENFFGQIVSAAQTIATMPVSRLDSETTAQLAITLQGVTSRSHAVRVSLNGNDIGSVIFANTDHATETFTINAADLLEGDNTIGLEASQGDDVSLVDFIRLTYAHKYLADNNHLELLVKDQETKRFGGFDNVNIRVIDVTSPSQVRELTPGANVTKLEDGTFAVDVQVPGATSLKQRKVLVFTEASINTAHSVRGNNASSWWSETGGADYLLITTGDLKSSVEPLAQLRRNQGMTVQVIDVEDLYDEFSFGEHSPQAVRDFLAKAAANWTLKPRYVVLAGDGSYDPKNYFGQGLNDLVPAKLIDTSLSETASDDWLADFNNDAMADLAIGRLPVRTVADMTALVAKIVNYENAAPDPSRGVLLVSDTGFEASSSALQSLLPAGTTVATVNRSSADDTTIRSQIIAGINQGPRVTNYIGHGSNGVWTGAALLSSSDAPNLTNMNRLSVFTMMTCYNGFFQDAFNDSLSEALLKARGGAVAVWASTTLTQPGGQNVINQEFYRMLFAAQPARLGDAARAAKAVTGDADVRRTWTLFGDPAMRLR